MKLLKKISVKEVYGKIDVRELTEETTPLMRVVGVASKVKTGDSTFGPWVAFIGQFQATNLKTQEKFASGKCFLPAQASELLEGQLSGDNAVEFAFDIGAIYDESSQINYQYTVVPLIETSENDPVALLASRVEKKLLT